MADSLDKGVLLCVNPNLTLSQPSGRDRGFSGGPWLRLLGRSVMGKLLARAVVAVCRLGWHLVVRRSYSWCDRFWFRKDCRA